MFSLESPYRGDSNEYILYTIYIIQKYPNLSQICSYGIISKGLKNEFHIDVVEERSVVATFTVYSIELLLLATVEIGAFIRAKRVQHNFRIM